MLQVEIWPFESGRRVGESYAKTFINNKPWMADDGVWLGGKNTMQPPSKQAPLCREECRHNTEKGEAQCAGKGGNQIKNKRMQN